MSRSTRALIGASIAILTLLSLGASGALAAPTPDKGSVSPSSPTTSWKGNVHGVSYVGQGGVEASCPEDGVCDEFKLTVTGGNVPDGQLKIETSAPPPPADTSAAGGNVNDVDIIVKDPKGGQITYKNTGKAEETVVVDQPEDGVYTVWIYGATGGGDYTAKATLTAPAPSGTGPGGDTGGGQTGGGQTGGGQTGGGDTSGGGQQTGGGTQSGGDTRSQQSITSKASVSARAVKAKAAAKGGVAVKVTVKVNEIKNVVIDLLNAKGKRVARLRVTRIAVGTKTVKIKARGLKKGSYRIVLAALSVDGKGVRATGKVKVS